MEQSFVISSDDDRYHMPTYAHNLLGESAIIAAMCAAAASIASSKLVQGIKSKMRILDFKHKPKAKSNSFKLA